MSWLRRRVLGNPSWLRRRWRLGGFTRLLRRHAPAPAYRWCSYCLVTQPMTPGAGGVLYCRVCCAARYEGDNDDGRA